MGMDVSVGQRWSPTAVFIAVTTTSTTKKAFVIAQAPTSVRPNSAGRTDMARTDNEEDEDQGSDSYTCHSDDDPERRTLTTLLSLNARLTGRGVSSDVQDNDHHSNGKPVTGAGGGAADEGEDSEGGSRANVGHWSHLVFPRIGGGRWAGMILI